MKEILVTGANRGLGLEFARQYAEAGHRVQATCRHPGSAEALQELAAAHPDRIAVRELNVTDTAQIAAIASAVLDDVGRLDLLINNAGVTQRGEELSNLEARSMLDVFAVNSVAPMIMTRGFLPLLQSAERPAIVNISSQMGSLSEKDYGRHYSYCASKAALNMLTRAAAHDLRDDGIVVVALHPGWVRTGLGGDGAPLTTQESVADMIGLIDGLTPEHSGRFLTRDGQDHPW